MTETKGWDDLSEVESYTHSNNLMLIDGNNLGYRWIGRTNYDSFEEEYISTIESLGRSYSATRIIVCFDFGRSYYRLAMHDKYKGTRKKPETEEEIAKYEAFFNCLNNVIKHLPMEYYKYRGIEADDIIAFFTENLSQKYDHTWIVSSDKDLYQVLSDKISIFNLFSRKEISEDSLLEDCGLTPEEYMLSRLMEGDKSDNIAGIEGIGPKRAQTIIREYKTLPELLKALPIKGKSKYITNLNAGAEILKINEQLINLKQHLEPSIKAGKDGDEVWKELNEIVNRRT